VKPYLHLLPNPANFVVGGVSVATSSLDVLMLLSKQEVAQCPASDPTKRKPLERLPRLASHVLQQRQFLPLHPVPMDSKAPIAIDPILNVKMGGIDKLPDILLLPSDLAPFAKESLGGVLCINPGRLVRMQVGGSFASICIHPKSMMEADTEMARHETDAKEECVSGEDLSDVSSERPVGIAARAFVEVARI